ncbi:transcriptional regulator [Microbacterium sp. gxy059]|uniref:transcriptional regulator n=1 Tax=Microbacterium sp. gxy059 TaxID=2957199 RepID=UPI003D97F258
MTSHPRHGLDDAFQTPIRFSLMAALREDAEMDFRMLREMLETSDSVLSKAIGHLEQLGYVRTVKGYVGSRPRTWAASTVTGRRAFRRHVAALRAIADGGG